MSALDQASLDKIWSREIDQPFNPRPTWPGGESGITIGGGYYDCGQQSALRIQIDWIGLPDLTLTRLASYAGIKGVAARALLPKTQDILTPEDFSRDVFEATVIPRYAALTASAFPNCDKLPPGCFGALVSLVFNRGADMGSPTDQTDTRAEMREIRDAMAAENFDLIPGLIRSMQRLWAINPVAGVLEPKPGLRGLFSRRADEADQFQAALHPSLNSELTT